MSLCNNSQALYLTPTYVGYRSFTYEKDAEAKLDTSAQCFDPGGRQPASLLGQATVLEWLKDVVGHKWLFERIASLHIYAYHALKQVAGVTMLTPRAGASGLISLILSGHDDAEVVTRLHKEHNIYIRNIPSMKALRISTGFYNTEEEIDQLVQALLAL